MPKTYKEEISPLWLEEIKQAFGWTNPVNALIRTTFLLFGLWFAFWLTGNLDDLIGSLAVLLGQIVIFLATFISIIMYTYVRATSRLYNQQVQKRLELGEFIENPFEVIARPPYEKEKDKPRWASFNVLNTTSLVIDKCYVELISVTDFEGNKVIPIIQNLKWSRAHGEENRTKELDLYRSPRICDVAFTIPNLDIIIFETWAGQYSAVKGVYNLIIEVHGLYKGFIKDEKFKLTMEYNGGNLINILTEGQEKWKDEELDPKPPLLLIVKDALTTKKKKPIKRKASSR